MTAILIYHQVAEVPKALDPLGLAMPPAQFERQMEYLARHGYHCLTLAEAVRHFRLGTRAPRRSFVLTFDDGYRDLYTVVHPILEKFGFTAVVFLVAGRMGLLSNWRGQDEERAGLLLSQAEARYLAGRGYTLGSHTLHHPALNTLDDHSALNEIQESRSLLQDQLGTQVDFFSYPYSAVNACIEEMVRSAGYTAACAGDTGPWSLFHLWRVPCLRDDSDATFAMKVNGLYDQRTALRESPAGQVVRRAVLSLRRRKGGSAS